MKQKIFNLSKQIHEEIKHLNSPLSSKDTEFLIKNLLINKTLNPNGFIEFCQIFKELIVILQNLFQKTRDGTLYIVFEASYYPDTKIR